MYSIKVNNTSYMQVFIIIRHIHIGSHTINYVDTTNFKSSSQGYNQVVTSSNKRQITQSNTHLPH